MSNESTAKIVTWDGHEVPLELRNLPPGRYTLEPIEDWGLTRAEESELEEAVSSIDRGEGIPGEVVAEQLRQQIALKKRR